VSGQKISSAAGLQRASVPAVSLVLGKRGGQLKQVAMAMVQQILVGVLPFTEHQHAHQCGAFTGCPGASRLMRFLDERPRQQTHQREHAQRTTR
jgi:hypothetical protein